MLKSVQKNRLFAGQIDEVCIIELFFERRRSQIRLSRSGLANDFRQIRNGIFIRNTIYEILPK